MLSKQPVGRLDAIAFSPVFAHFTETVAGLETLRAFRLQDSFIARDQAMLEQSNRAFWPIQCVNRRAPR